MDVVSELLPGVMELVPRRFADSRGWFSETYSVAAFAKIGLADTFVQDNQSFSEEVGTVRGLHLQLPPSAQGKLVRVLSGAIFDVAVDLRPGADTYGHHAAVTLSAERGNMLWIAPGYAHGFCTIEPNTTVFYKVTAPYDPASERSVRWDDPTIGIDWPIAAGAARLSDKDQVAPLLADTDWTAL